MTENTGEKTTKKNISNKKIKKNFIFQFFCYFLLASNFLYVFSVILIYSNKTKKKKKKNLKINFSHYISMPICFSFIYFYDCIFFFGFFYNFNFFFFFFFFYHFYSWCFSPMVLVFLPYFNSYVMFNLSLFFCLIIAD